MGVVSQHTYLNWSTEPIFVPAYWHPPTLFDLAERMGFDFESLLFAFATGGLASAGFFVALYVVYFVPLMATHPGYVQAVWNLPALSGVRVFGIPLEELLFAGAFGWMWSSVYEHLAWTREIDLGAGRVHSGPQV